MRQNPVMRRRFGQTGSAALVAAILGLYFWMATSAADQKSNTFDEVAHLTGGVAGWSLNDYGLHPENGNWPQRIAALPIVLDQFTFPVLNSNAWRGSDVFGVGDQFFFNVGNDLDAMLAKGRRMIALLGVALGVLLFACSRRANGTTGAFITLIAFAFSPTMLAHGALITSDMAAALFFAAASAAVWRVLHDPTPKVVALSAFWVSGLFLSKYSAVIFIPIAACMVAVRCLSRVPLTLGRGRWNGQGKTAFSKALAIALIACVHALTAVVLIWASYGFRYTAFIEGESSDRRFVVDWATLQQSQDGTISGLVRETVAIARRYRLLPEPYLYGVSFQASSVQSRRSFLNGKYSDTGFREFFPYAFAVKTTLPFLALLVLAGLRVFSRRDAQYRRRWIIAEVYKRSPWLILATVYVGFAINSNLNIGHRHLLPIYPALFVLVGGAAAWLRPERSKQLVGPKRLARARASANMSANRAFAISSTVRRSAAGAVLLLLGWHAWESIAIRPNYLAYFNPVSGGPSLGYKHLVDSSLDWGQDLPTLKQWLNREGVHERVFLSYFGTSNPFYYGIQAELLQGYFDRRASKQPLNLTAGWYCISATMLQGVYLSEGGPWTTGQEDTYRRLGELVRLHSEARTPEETQALRVIEEASGRDFWPRALAYFDELRTARLFAYLRKQQPDATIGYSIMAYRMTEARLALALVGPPPY